MNLPPLKVLNTRPAGQNAALSQSIKKAGCISIELPVIEIQALEQWIHRLPSLTSIQYAVFISANAADLFFKNLTTKQLIWPASISVIAIGHATRSALNTYGVQTVLTPSQANSERLIEMPILKKIKPGAAVLIIKGEGGRLLISKALLDRGATVLEFDVYRRTLPNYPPSVLHSLWQDDAVDIILVTSQQGLENLFALFDQSAHAWLKQKTWLVISDRISKTATLYGINNVIVSPYDEISNQLKFCDVQIKSHKTASKLKGSSYGDNQ